MAPLGIRCSMHGRSLAKAIQRRSFLSSTINASASRTMVQSQRHSSSAPYKLQPLRPHFGAEVWGISLDTDEPLPAETVHRIKEDMKQYRVLVFKGQPLISGERQAAISKQLGDLESTFYKHPRSPHPDVFRVSNDEREGCTQVGRTGWHVDGTFQAKPFKYQTMHLHAVCEDGETWFIPLREFFERQNQETQLHWDRLWMITGRQQLAHPLVYKHPVRGDTTMVFHCGQPFCAGWARDDDALDTAKRSVKELLRPGSLQDELTQKADEAVDEIGIKMQWEEGDFAINDNLGNAHYAPPGTQSDRKAAGLRLLHRTTIAGETVPTKADGRSSFPVNF